MPIYIVFRNIDKLSMDKSPARILAVVQFTDYLILFKYQAAGATHSFIPIVYFLQVLALVHWSGV